MLDVPGMSGARDVLATDRALATPPWGDRALVTMVSSLLRGRDRLPGRRKTLLALGALSCLVIVVSALAYITDRRRRAAARALTEPAAVPPLPGAGGAG
jgi:type II secretory pathway component PulM